ncbi:carbohydrate ABC transporter permease [Clostridium cibarium]|nr:carbohydrate ABC transporter permease [Clostridium cibarium]
MIMSKKRKKDIFNTPAGRVFDVFNIIILGVFGFITIVPFLFVIAGSFSSELELSTRHFFIIPHGFTLEAYKYIFDAGNIFRSLLTTIGVTVVGTIVQLFCTFSMAYPLSRKGLRGRSFLMKCVVITMVFSGGMIPTFLVVKSLGLLDSYWALILPVAINPFNLIIIKNTFQEFPEELIEAAKIDGCSEIRTFIKIVLPLSMPTIATFTLFYAVGTWNDFFNAFLYINDSSKWTLQIILRQITLMSDIAANGDAVATLEIPKEAVKLGTIAVATIPILCIYPFLQKHFAKGMMLGSVKG